MTVAEERHMFPDRAKRRDGAAIKAVPTHHTDHLQRSFEKAGKG